MSDESELQRALTDAIALRPGDELFGHTLKAKGVSMDCFGWWMSDGGFATLPNIIGYLRAHPKEAKAPSSGIAPPGSVPIASVRQAKTRKNPMGSSRKRHGWQARLARARRLANRNFATVFYVDDGGVILLSGKAQASLTLDGMAAHAPLQPTKRRRKS